MEWKVCYKEPDDINLTLTNLTEDEYRTIAKTLKLRNYMPGDIFTYAGKDWDIMHVTEKGTLILGLREIPFDVVFGRNNEYKNSSLENFLSTWEEDLRMSFPEIEAMQGDFFIPTQEEIETYTNPQKWVVDCISNQAGYWTSSKYGLSSDAVFVVGKNGNFTWLPSYYTYGFRPFVEIDPYSLA